MSTSGSADFVSLDLGSDEFRELGYRTVDMIADYFDGIRDYPVFPGKAQSEVEAEFVEDLPETGQAPGSILQEWEERVLPNATHLGSPRYFGYVNGSGTMMGVLAEALAASVNMNAGGWRPAPAATEIERRTVRWVAEMIGYPTGCGGMFTGGGTMANLTGILTGLRARVGRETKARGHGTPTGRGRYTIYMSDHEGHSSIYRVAEVLGLGSDAVRLVPSRDDFTMDVDALEERLLAEAFAMHAAYLEGTMRTPYEGLDYFEASPKMSRGFKALKVWMTLKHYGVEGYRRLLGQNVRCAEHLDARVRQADDFVALHEPNLNLYSFQYAPPDLQETGTGPGKSREAVDRYLDDLNQRIADEIQLSGVAFVMTTSIHGRTVLRLSICSHRTTLEDIDRTFETLQEIGGREDRRLRRSGGGDT